MRLGPIGYNAHYTAAKSKFGHVASTTETASTLGGIQGGLNSRQAGQLNFDPVTSVFSKRTLDRLSGWLGNAVDWTKDGAKGLFSWSTRKVRGGVGALKALRVSRKETSAALPVPEVPATPEFQYA